MTYHVLVAMLGAAVLAVGWVLTTRLGDVLRARVSVEPGCPPHPIACGRCATPCGAQPEAREPERELAPVARPRAADDARNPMQGA